MRPARRTATKSRCRGRGAHFSARPARHTPHGVGTYTTNQEGEVGVVGCPASTSMMSSTGVATLVHPSALARESSPLEMASDTLDAEGTLWKSGTHCLSAARPQNEARMPLGFSRSAAALHQGELPGDIVHEAIQYGLRRLAGRQFQVHG